MSDDARESGLRLGEVTEEYLVDEHDGAEVGTAVVEGGQGGLAVELHDDGGRAFHPDSLGGDAKVGEGGNDEIRHGSAAFEVSLVEFLLHHAA